MPHACLSQSNGTNPAWFCLRSQTKREHIAAAHLRTLENVEVFNPRLRIRKATSRGPVTFIEAFFPSYLFARFDPARAMDRVKHSPSVSTVVHFGAQIPVVPEEVIRELKSGLGEDEIQDCELQLDKGAKVTIAEGPFQGLTATVLRVLTPYERVEVLLEMLGRTSSVVTHPSSLVAGDFSPRN